MEGSGFNKPRMRLLHTITSCCSLLLHTAAGGPFFHCPFGRVQFTIIEVAACFYLQGIQVSVSLESGDKHLHCDFHEFFFLHPRQFLPVAPGLHSLCQKDRTGSCPFSGNPLFRFDPGQRHPQPHLQSLQGLWKNWCHGQFR